MFLDSLLRVENIRVGRLVGHFTDGFEKERINRLPHCVTKVILLGFEREPLTSRFEQDEISSSIGLDFQAQCDDEGEVLYKCPRFLGIFVTWLTVGGLIDDAPCGEIYMVIKDLDLEPKINTMMRDFLNSSWRKELSKETGIEILPSGDGSRVYVFSRQSHLPEEYRQGVVADVYIARKLSKSVVASDSFRLHQKPQINVSIGRSNKIWIGSHRSVVLQCTLRIKNKTHNPNQSHQKQSNNTKPHETGHASHTTGGRSYASVLNGKEGTQKPVLAGPITKNITLENSDLLELSDTSSVVLGKGKDVHK
ncbi:hypothetical protein Tco_0644342 [Tanacetum coccineum]